MFNDELNPHLHLNVFFILVTALGDLLDYQLVLQIRSEKREMCPLFFHR